MIVLLSLFLKLWCLKLWSKTVVSNFCLDFVSYAPGRSGRPVRALHKCVTDRSDSDVGAHSGVVSTAVGCELCVRSRKTSVAVDVMRYPRSALFPSKNPTAWVHFASDRSI